MRKLAVVLVAVLLTACGTTPAPTPTGPVELRQTPPPWDVPADDSGYIAAAGLEPQPLDLTTNQHVITMSITVDGDAVPIAGKIGVDQPRAVQAPVHTHDDSGQVWLEGKDVDQVTLGQFFTVWGVRFTDTCLGAVCGAMVVTTQPALDVAKPTELRLAQANALAITVVSKPVK